MTRQGPSAVGHDCPETDFVFDRLHDGSVPDHGLR